MRHPEYYLGRADEARRMAQATVDPKARDDLIKCAMEYEDLAKQATVKKSEELANRVKLGWRLAPQGQSKGHVDPLSFPPWLDK
jgi:hypothetical protein